MPDGFYIDAGSGDVCQFFVGRHLFIERFLQKRRGALMAHLFGISAHGPIDRDFIVLYALAEIMAASRTSGGAS
jgi:hypothetical protein